MNPTSALTPFPRPDNVHVLFHKNCLDGTGAKFAAWSRFGGVAQYTPVQYGEPLPEIADGKDVYILDFSYSRDVLEQLRARSSSILVLDHHKTAKEALDGLPYAQFDMDRSGAVMAWQHFFSGQPIPDLLLDVQDRDLWKWSRETSKDTTAGLPLLESSMNLWAEAAVDLSYLGEVRAAGNAKNQFDEMLIESRIKHVKEILLEDGKRTKPFKCAVINTTVLGSEMGNELCKVGYDVAILYFLTDEGEVVLSFRSIGDVDVSALAKKLHGGGHKNAAGARVAIPGLGVLYSGRPSLHINELITHAIIPYK